MMTLEQTIESHSSKIQKLRADKSQLQSLLELEKSSFAKMEFEYKSLQTMFDGLKAQVTRFQEHVDTGTTRYFPNDLPDLNCLSARLTNDNFCFLAVQDSKSFRFTATAMDEKVKELETRVSATVDECDKKGIDCQNCTSKPVLDPFFQLLCPKSNLIDLFDDYDSASKNRRT